MHRPPDPRGLPPPCSYSHSQFILAPAFWQAPPSLSLMPWPKPSPSTHRLGTIPKGRQHRQRKEHAFWSWTEWGLSWGCPPPGSCVTWASPLSSLSLAFYPSPQRRGWHSLGCAAWPGEHSSETPLTLHTRLSAPSPLLWAGGMLPVACAGLVSFVGWALGAEALPHRAGPEGGLGTSMG